MVLIAALFTAVLLVVYLEIQTVIVAAGVYLWMKRFHEFTDFMFWVTGPHVYTNSISLFVLFGVGDTGIQP